jgi:hypothetical protein
MARKRQELARAVSAPSFCCCCCCCQWSLTFLDRLQGGAGPKSGTPGKKKADDDDDDGHGASDDGIVAFAVSSTVDTGI